MQRWSSQFIAVHKGFKVLKLRYQMAQGQDNPSHADRNKRTQFSMCIFLPDAFDGLPNLVDTIASQPGFLHRHLPKRKIEVRELRVPKFKLSFHSSVVAILKKLELQLPFSDQADLSDMVERDGSDLPLVLSDVIHKAVIEVNEEGTVAAAVSMMYVDIGSSVTRRPPPPPPVDFVADHPFAYFIVEEATDAVVFAGHVLDPSN
uniref:Serpin domain-containing protein n=1 Tax=Triticum urartu TaxID=4572 RepID=A0A8R7U9E6_TRIUA